MSNYRKTMADALREMYPLTEETQIDEATMSSSQIAALKKAYEPMRDKRISTSDGNKLSAMMDKVGKDKEALIQLFKADIPFVSQSAATKLITKHNMKGAEINKLREDVDLDEGFINIGGAKVKDDEKSILQHIKKTFPNVKKVRKDPNHGWIPVFEEVDLDEAKYTYKAATFNGNTVVGTGSTEEDAIKDAKNKAKELGSTLRKRISMKKEGVDLDEATKQVLAHGGKGKYKVTKDGDTIEIKFGGKVVGTADFDRGADSFFVSIKGEKGQKSFDDAQAIADYFAKNKITEGNDLDEGKQKPYISSDSDGKHVMGASGKIVKSFKDMDSANAYLKKNYNELMKESDLDEGKMSQLHQYMQDKKSPEEIAKLMKLDVKTIKSLMSSHHPEDVEEASAYADARRSMSKDKDFSRKDSADDDTDASDDDVKGASKNIIMQMRKAQSLSGNFAVEFGDGKKVKIPAKMAVAVQQKYNAMKKPVDKEKFQARIGKSYKDMLSALKEELQPKKESILERMNRKLKENKHG
jgi:hypothetical protein